VQIGVAKDYTLTLVVAQIIIGNGMIYKKNTFSKSHIGWADCKGPTSILSCDIRFSLFSPIPNGIYTFFTCLVNRKIEMEDQIEETAKKVSHHLHSASCILEWLQI